MIFQQEIKDKVLELKIQGKTYRFIAYELSIKWPLICGGKIRPRNFNDVDIAKIVQQLEEEGRLPIGKSTKFHNEVKNLPRGRNRKTVVREGAK